ncbi:MAG TPA: type II secretion system F family protein [Candidatus Jorgensenbacteria bacterium]|nr:type II secretion system F family protein [Candidatus Jorgensenbacteria bacterium]
MAQFHYIASQPDGRIVESELEAQQVSDVLQFLTSRGLKPISVKLVERAKEERKTLFRGRVTIADQIFLFRYLTLMLQIGTNLLQAVNILIDDFDKPSVKSFLLEVRSNLERGQPFHSTFAKYPKVFSSVHINLIKAGEVSGNLQNICDNITQSLLKEKGLRDQLRNALIYPTMLLGISVFILIFLITFALPKIAGVFLDSGFEPPVFSRVVFTVGLFIGKIWFWLFGGFILLAFLFFYLYRTSLFFRRFLWSVVTDIPVVSDIIKKRAIQRFAATFSSLVKAGITITGALEITADAAGHEEMKQALLRISREGISKGLVLGEAFRRETFFPKMVVNLIAIAEKAGHVENVLETLADFYIGEIDNSLKRLVSLLEPILLLIIGFVIGIIALAIIVPIYELTTQF